MKTKLTLKPGQNGTKQLVAEYGERLVCVRYRYDTETGRRVKTAEIIVDERAPQRSRPPVVVGVRVDWQEGELREKVKQAGARWNAKKKLWELGYARAVENGLKDRIVESSHQI